MGWSEDGILEDCCGASVSFFSCIFSAAKRGVLADSLTSCWIWVDREVYWLFVPLFGSWENRGERKKQMTSGMRWAVGLNLGSAQCFVAFWFVFLQFLPFRWYLRFTFLYMILVSCVSLSESMQIKFLNDNVIAWNHKHVLYSTFWLQKKSDLSLLSKESLNFNFAEKIADFEL